MDRTYVTDMRHYLDEDGELPAGIPGPALNLALFHGSIVGWVTSHHSNPKIFDADGSTIVWQCLACREGGLIRGWECTPWDRRVE